MNAASAQTMPTNYRALVCVFLYGGNDHSNMIVPFDNANYQLYAQSRTNLALAQNTLLPMVTPEQCVDDRASDRHASGNGAGSRRSTTRAGGRYRATSVP